MSQFSSGEFHPGGTGHAKRGGSMAQFGTYMHYLVPHAHGTLEVHTLNLDGVLSNTPDSVTDDGKWRSSKLEDLVSNSNSADFESNYRPQLAALGDRLYAFWVDDHNNQVYAAYMTSAGSWSATAIKVHINEDTPLDKVKSNISCYTVSDNIVLSWTAPGNNKTLVLYTLNLTEGALDELENVWTGCGAPQVDPRDCGLSIDTDYHKISTEWFCQGNDTETVQSWMAVGFYSSDARETLTLAVPVDEAGLPSFSDGRDTLYLGGFNNSREVELVREPGGRIMALFCRKDDDHDANLSYRLLNTWEAMSGDNLWGNRIELNNSVNFDSHTSEKALSGIFLNSGNRSGTVTITDANGNPEQKSASQYTVYLFVAYARGDESDDAYKIRAQMGQYGIASSVTQMTSMQATDQSITSMNMIMDAFPLDNAYVIAMSGSTSLLTLEYGTTSSTMASHSVSGSAMLGIKSTVTTTKGFGPAIDVAFKTGASSMFTDSLELITQTAYGVETAITSVDGREEVTNAGILYGMTAFDMIEDAFLLADVNGEFVGGVTAPLYSRLRPVNGENTHRRSSGYTSYAYVPGDIHTYTEQEINQRMRDLYASLSADKQALFPDGYGSDYIEEIVKPRAYVLSGSEEDGSAVKYLEFTVNAAGISRDGFRAIDKTLNETGVSLDGSTYVGVGTGEEVSVFGLGESVSASDMVGFEISVESLDSEETGSEWGVNLGVSNSFPFGTSGVPGYTVHMYLLKPDPLWANELRYFSPDGQSIVNNGFELSISQPAKIMYVVYPE